STFTLDSDDTGGDVILKFGTTLAETLKWDTGNNYFLLSDALVVDGNVAVQGTTFTLDSDETGNPDQDADIVAEQGSESNGVIRYDDGNNRWEISNNGAVFEPIISGTVNAETLDTLDSAQFVRSDTSDSYTSGTLTFNSGTTLDGNGTIDFSGATRFVIRSGSANPGTCAEGDLFYNSTDNVLRVCTDTDTWTALGSGSSNADTLDTIDSLQFLRSDASDALTSGTLTINTGAALDVNGDLDASGATRMAVHQGTSNPGTCTEGDLFYNSTDNLLRACSATNTWSVVRDGGNSGTLDSLDSTQLLRSDTNDSFTSGILTFSSGTTLNVDGALDVNGVATIGDNGDNVTIDSSVWDISSPGVASGLTGITSTGAINFSGSSSIRLRESSSVPGTCTVGEQYFDTTTKTLRSCTTTNVFSSSTTGTNYLFGYDTTDQAVSSAGNFQTITFNNPTSVANGWTYSAGNFTTPVTGLYSITYSAYAGRNSKGDSTVTVRATRGGTEIAGSVGYTSPSRDDRPVALSNTFLVNLTAGDLLKFQLTGSTSSNSTGLYESNADGTVQPTITVTIRRIN
ncbi:MAG: hypothetical protein U1C97_02215, partial [Candidatus Gracilibacteria bacterium]|nr:hypothetical protein [Candidatus Gracilibacteria bacterium]